MISPCAHLTETDDGLQVSYAREADKKAKGPYGYGMNHFPISTLHTLDQMKTHPYSRDTHGIPLIPKNR
jgi:hypothetical protein